jgi:hypothetical protein
MLLRSTSSMERAAATCTTPTRTTAMSHTVDANQDDDVPHRGRQPDRASRYALDTMSFTRCQSIVDPWSGLGTIKKTFAEAGHAVHSNDLHPNACADGHSDALLYETYANWRHTNNLEVIVTSPHFTFLDIALPLAAGMVRDVACVH